MPSSGTIRFQVGSSTPVWLLFHINNYTTKTKNVNKKRVDTQRKGFEPLTSTFFIEAVWVQHTTLNRSDTFMYQISHRGTIHLAFRADSFTIL